MTAVTNRPLPEMLGREDMDIRGEWAVSECAPVRGMPATTIEGRAMAAPYGDDELSKLIRVHEMVHAKVTPSNFHPWLTRGIASLDALIACEELRVNYLSSKLGYDMKALSDGSECSAGERVVALNDWNNAVRFAIATAGTAGHKEFIKGVRRHNKVWANVLSDIARRGLKQAKKFDTSYSLSSTIIDTHLGGDPRFIRGFRFTEQLGEWVDRLCEAEPQTPNKKEKDSSPSGDSDSSGDESDDSDDSTDEPTSDEYKRAKERSMDAVRSIRMSDTLPPDFMEMKVSRPLLSVALSGAMGKKRVPAQSGRSPRRIHRMMTDPQRRVFDRVIRGKGGVVLIDVSGSMHLDRDDIRRIVDVAKGATVVAYSCQNFEFDDEGLTKDDNAWVLAHRGRIIDELPDEMINSCYNGNDLPALKWAVANRDRHDTPIVWVCDGGVTGIRDESHDALSIRCVEFCLKYKITVVPDVEQCIIALTKIVSNQKPENKWGMLWSYASELMKVSR